MVIYTDSLFIAKILFIRKHNYAHVVLKLVNKYLETRLCFLDQALS